MRATRRVLRPLVTLATSGDAMDSTYFFRQASAQKYPQPGMYRTGGTVNRLELPPMVDPMVDPMADPMVEPMAEPADPE